MKLNLENKTFYKKIDHFFKIGDRKSTIKKELIGGLSIFLAMMYILAVNPSMLINSNGINENQEYIAGIFLGTALSSFIATFAMGLFANVPMALAPGMGLNAFFTYTVASSDSFGLNYYQALICVMISGILYAIIAITPARLKLMELMPKNLKTIIVVMIGFFLCYVGLVNIGIVSQSGVATEIGHNFSPSKNSQYPIVIIGTLALIIEVVLFYCKVKNSIIITSAITVIMLLITWAINSEFTISNGVQAFSIRDYGQFSSFGEMAKSMFDGNNWKLTFMNPASYVAIFTFLYVDFFDTSSTLFAIGKNMELIDDDELKETKWIKSANYVDAGGTICGALLLNSSVTVLSESDIGVKLGARTGLSSIFISLLFLISLAAWPIMGPFMPIGSFQPVTGHAIFLTGMLMISQIRTIDFNKYLDIPILIINILFFISIPFFNYLYQFYFI